MIYFIQVANGGPIKIGYTVRNDARERAAALQTASPWKLDVVYTMPGNLADEARLHAQFAHLRMRGEWFKADHELVSWLQARRAHPMLGRVVPFTGAQVVKRRFGPLTLVDSEVLRCTADDWRTTSEIAARVGVTAPAAAGRLSALRTSFGYVQSQRRYGENGSFVEWKSTPLVASWFHRESDLSKSAA